MSRISVTGRLYLLSQFQWAPTLTEHDPNPPLTINDPPAPPAGSISALMFYVRQRRTK